ncbi:MAG: transcription-repair coupling factor [Ruminococcaceae bacterium]|nr:transcription-repair coupling factor [Oscillospiraceae bacterium]
MQKRKGEFMTDITQAIRKEREYEAITLTRKNGLCRPMLVGGLCDGAEFALIKNIIEDNRRDGRITLLIFPDEKRITAYHEWLSDFGLRCGMYFYKDPVLHNMTVSHESERSRLKVLSGILSRTLDAVLTTPDAALQFTVPMERLQRSAITVCMGETYSPESVVEVLENSGFYRTDMVETAGQYAVRGGILDIFSPSFENPVRIDFFGDEIDRMCFFDIMTQRQLSDCEELTIIPAKEILPDARGKEALISAIKARLRATNDIRAKELLNEELEIVESGRELGCIDKYIGVIYPQCQCLLDYMEDAEVIVSDYTGVNEKLKSRDFFESEAIRELLEENLISPKTLGISEEASTLQVYLFGRRTLVTDSFGAGIPEKQLSGLFSFRTKQTVTYGDNFNMLCDDLRGYVAEGYRIKLICENEAEAKNLTELLCESGFGAYEDRGGEQRVGSVALSYGSGVRGFELISLRYVCLSTVSSASFMRRRKTVNKKKKDKNLQKIMSYADLSEGDYVVHETHGIGKYAGMSPLVVEGVRRDFIKIAYAGTDVLYLPCTQLDKISKYIGPHSDDGMLKLSKMGGTDWAKAKTRAKSAAKDMAKELIALYAARMKKEGYAFPKDDSMQREFEDAFEYEETESQMAAIEDIKRDMERKQPMDRLLCGDVGYGKTEVALRAAFKAVCGGKQVAILVPTTILAMQHYRTMLSRMRGFPVKVDMLSRFRKPSEQELTMRKLRRGEVDIIVGTHRLLSKDIQFKDLGLLIIDEEQRFGVAHKEKLKQIAGNVDVLTLSATPIPRTLNMALGGIRDMSILDEAPGDRLPVQTYVLPYDPLLLGEAMRKELRRGGQIFYLCNRIERMDHAVSAILAQVPDARVATANGKMTKDELSDIWERMVSADIDVLVSTTIIETGVDVPNANTLIIEDADKFGLSQLHQIRGRVGRSRRRAYAYFTYPKNKQLSEISEKRLSAIRDFTEFGSGFRVAMRDMEIRGAGNLLGAEQHGQMDTIGYDLYMKLLNEAVLEEKGEWKAPKPECAVDLNVNAYLPEDYVKNQNQRIDVYRKISLLENDEDMQDVYDEIMDRYGAPPDPVLNLLRISLIRSYAAEAGFHKVEYRSGGVLFFSDKPNLKAFSALAANYRGRILINLSNRPYAALRQVKVHQVTSETLAMLRCYKKLLQEQA